MRVFVRAPHLVTYGAWQISKFTCPKR
ncbi:protein of unknown function [uncultured Sphingopyxis sp.]|uniref:Uncharacterized protein n=1 Tax=uncultured Sphingopyxis sp. TaxID=310581 RepID=A0A1Y5PWY1_9SPHN|nr:protein of unknown function [uncultured Sphingopyxis sp.]